MGQSGSLGQEREEIGIAIAKGSWERRIIEAMECVGSVEREGNVNNFMKLRYHGE